MSCLWHVLRAEQVHAPRTSSAIKLLDTSQAQRLAMLEAVASLSSVAPLRILTFPGFP